MNTVVTEVFPQPTVKSVKFIHIATDLQIQLLFAPFLLPPTTTSSGKPFMTQNPC